MNVESEIKALEAQLQREYQRVQEAAQQRIQHSIGRLEAVDAASEQDVILKAERDAELTKNIAADLVKCAAVASMLISRKSGQVFNGGYQAARVTLTFWLPDSKTLYALHYAKKDPKYCAAEKLAADRLKAAQYYSNAMNKLGSSKIITNELKNQLLKGLSQGESMNQIAQRIMSITQRSYADCIRIARTECMRALNQGHMLCLYEAQAMGIKCIKKWIATHDDRTRESHNHMDGETAEPEELFSNGLMYPHDPNGSPEETINCRCTFVTIPVL